MRSALLGILLLDSVLLMAQAVPSPTAGAGNTPQDAEAQRPETAPAPAPEPRPKVYVEVGGTWNRFRPGGDSWRGGDARVICSGFTSLTPFASIGTLNSENGTQVTASAGSYVKLHKNFFSIVGASVAPNARTTFFPRARFDVSGHISIPPVQGLILSTGMTEIKGYSNGDGGRIFSVGSIYYTPVGIFSGNFNFNQSRPSGLRSTSGQFGIMHGAQGKFWISAGIGGGNVAYQLLAGNPFDVRYSTVNFFGSFQKWVSRDAGFSIRFDRQRALDNFSRYSLKPGLFFNF